MSQRTARLDELLREEIAGILARQVHDPRLGFLTVTDVDVTPDLRHATVWVSLLGAPEERKGTLHALESAMPFVRRQLRGLRLKRIPELQVRVDDSVERGSRVLQLLHELESGTHPVETPPAESLPSPVPQPAADERRPRRPRRRPEVGRR
jgi:ribosome-binding factor A